MSRRRSASSKMSHLRESLRKHLVVLRWSSRRPGVHTSTVTPLRRRAFSLLRRSPPDRLPGTSQMKGRTTRVSTYVGGFTRGGRGGGGVAGEVGHTQARSENAQHGHVAIGGVGEESDEIGKSNRDRGCLLSHSPACWGSRRRFAKNGSLFHAKNICTSWRFVQATKYWECAKRAGNF